MDRKDKAQVKDINKKIKQGIRDKRHEKVQIILEEFTGMRSIASIKTRKENSHHSYEKRSWKHRSNEDMLCQHILEILQRSVLKKER